jgi:hypothetical protein
MDWKRILEGESKKRFVQYEFEERERAGDKAERGNNG